MFELDTRPWGIRYPDYKNYHIIKGANDKFGVIDRNTQLTIMDCLFDDIVWIEELQMVKFYSNHKEAICKISELDKIVVSIP